MPGLHFPCQSLRRVEIEDLQCLESVLRKQGGKEMDNASRRADTCVNASVGDDARTCAPRIGRLQVLPIGGWLASRLAGRPARAIRIYRRRTLDVSSRETGFLDHLCGVA